MKELNTFRKFITEAKFKVGDKVTMNNGGPEMEITKTRRMFGSDLNAYSVKKADGEEMEYDEKQLRLAEASLDESLNPEVTNKVNQFIKAMAKRYGYEEQDAVYAIMAALKQRKFEGLNEGVWSVLPDRIPEFIQKITDIKDEYHGVVGSDDVYDGLDRAIMAAEELLNMELREE